MSQLAIVVPCYQEEQALPETSRRLREILELLVSEHLVSENSLILFVNDGSDDKTWPIIEELHSKYGNICGVNLAGNVGHQNALIAGLSVAADMSDIVITIDADLQDDVTVIREMVLDFLKGNDIVYGVRSSRETDTLFKRFTANNFYRLMKLLGVRTIDNHADFRLMSKRAVRYLLQFEERNLFLRGIVPMVGYKYTKVFYTRKERFAGESKYPFKKMVSFAADGITSFSVAPVHLVLYIGLLFLFVSFLILCWVLWCLMTERAIQGWASLILSIWFCSGCVLTGLGVVGEYIGKIYIEVKHRPRYNIEKILV